MSNRLGSNGDIQQQLKKKQIIDLFLYKKEKSVIAKDKVLLCIDQKYWYFSYLSMKTCCVYSLEVPLQGTSNEHPQYIFLLRDKKDNFSYHHENMPT